MRITTFKELFEFAETGQFLFKLPANMNLTVNLTKEEYLQFKIDITEYNSKTAFLSIKDIPVEIKSVIMFGHTFNIKCNE